MQSSIFQHVFSIRHFSFFCRFLNTIEKIDIRNKILHRLFIFTPKNICNPLRYAVLHQIAATLLIALRNESRELPCFG